MDLLVTSPMHIAFRADASVEIGSGHVMRCLTLADALADDGATCHFICRDLPGHMIKKVTARGHAVTALPTPTADQTVRLSEALAHPVHAPWAGVPLEDEIAQCAEVLAGLAPDRVIVDHYALDARWETQAVPRGVPVMAIDDLANRPHHCDILLDQNLGREDADYEGLVPPHCVLLTGPRYALLRPEFARMRSASLQRRHALSLNHVMISMGGVDIDNATGKTLELLSQIPPGDLVQNLQLSVVMGASAPHLDDVRRRVDGMPHHCVLALDVRDMAGLMAQADLAIGAAGGSSWERCCLGVPTLLVVLADNQRRGAEALAASGAAVLLGDTRSDTWLEELRKHLPATAATAQLQEISSAAASLVDGQGAARVVAQIRLHQDCLRPATRHDIGRVWEWRYGNNAMRFYRSSDVPDLDVHTAWMKKALSDPHRDLRIFCHAGQPVAHIRFDISTEDPAEAEIGICLSCAVRGQGIGQRALRLAISSSPKDVRRLYADVHRDNTASVRIFEKSGFEPVGVDRRFIRMELQIGDVSDPMADREIP